MTRIRRTCPSCGKESCTKGDFCQYCAAEMTPIDQEETLTSKIEENEGGKTMSTRSKILGGIVIVLLLLGSFWIGAHNGNVNSVNNQATTSNKVMTTTQTGAKVETAALPVIHEGLDQASKSWFLAKAGTLISGDVCIFENDNNSQKIPVYDSKEGTADVIYLTSDTYIWTEWGCYTIENANAQDVAALINNKLDNHFNSVRYFNGFNKLGTNTPTIISSKIDAANIPLPAVTAK